MANYSKWEEYLNAKHDSFEIEFKEIDSSQLSEPKEGKEVTREQYNKIVRRKMEEMRNNGSWGGRHGGRNH